MFIIQKEYRPKSPHDWFARKVKEFGKEKYGLDLKVELIERPEAEKKELSDTQ